MRKKQLFALLMAGALTVGMTPAAAFAAVDDTTFLSVEEGALEEVEEELVETPTEAPVEIPTEAPTEAPTETPSETPSEAPTETPSEAPTEAPTDAPMQEQPSVPVAGEGELETPTEAPTEAPTPTETPENKIMIGETAYDSLAAAIAAVPADGVAVTILTAGTLEISETVSVPANKNIILASAAENTSIERAAGFTGDLFSVDGGTFQLSAGTGKDEATGETKTFALTVDGSTEDASATEGTIVNVVSGNFCLASNVTLKANTTTGNGGAIRNAVAGTIYLLGGSITGNQAVMGGAIYSEGVVAVQGDLSVTGNIKTEGLEENNITLSGDTAVITVTGALAESFAIGVNVNNPAERTVPVVALGDSVTDILLTDVLAKVTYNSNGDGYELDENGSLKVTEPDVTPEPTPEIKELVLKAVSMKWTGHNSLELVANSNKDGQYYVKWVKKGEKAPSFDLNKKGGDVVADYDFTAFVTDLPEEEVDIYICVQDNDKQNKAVLFQPNYKKRPAAPVTPTPDHVPVIPNVKDSIVRGLENPLEFYPNKFYDFTVIGAGTQNKNPGTGDVKWVPLYWSMSSNPADKDKHTAWRIGTTGGLKDAKTYGLFVFFQKAVYDGNNWQMTDTIESVSYSFMSKAITVTATPTPDPYGGNGGGGGGYYDENGNYIEDDDYDDPNDYSDEAGETKDAVATGDETPVGNMLALAAASLLAGGYVLVRRRKKGF